MSALVQTSIAQSPVPAAFRKPIPATLQDLQDIETHVQKIVQQVLPATVNLRIGAVQGSGVIIDRQGHILTAGHVSGAAGQDVVVILNDGRRLKGRTLGANKSIDSGMVRIMENADFDFVAMAKPGGVNKGTWCLALGHPGGYKPGRAPVVRLGRIQGVYANALRSDCTLVGGDSGGPVFDMHGHVIGIHSRIGNTLSANVHVPIATFQQTWSRLAAGEIWGDATRILSDDRPGPAYLGVRASPGNLVLKIDAVTPGSPADKAGLRANDVIVRIDNARLHSVDDLGAFLKQRRAGAQVHIQVRRGTVTLTIPVVLAGRSS